MKNTKFSIDLGSLSLEIVLDDKDNHLKKAKCVCKKCGNELSSNIDEAMAHTVSCLAKDVVNTD